MYSLGYCISNLLTEVILDVNISGVHDVDSFLCGLKTSASSTCVIERLQMFSCFFNVADLKLCPCMHGVTVLSLPWCGLDNTDMIHLSNLIPHMTCLKELSIRDNKKVSDGCGDGLHKVLQQLSHSRVATLHIERTSFCSLLNKSPHDYCSVFEHLIGGRLEELSVGDNDGDDDTRMISLVSSSSLKTLSLHHPKGSLVYLKTNTSLTKLSIELKSWNLPNFMPQLVDVLEHKTLQHLVVATFKLPLNIDTLTTFVNILHQNKTLLSIHLRISVTGFRCSSDDDVCSYIRQNHEELTLDSRIDWKYNAQYPFTNFSA